VSRLRHSDEEGIGEFLATRIPSLVGLARALTRDPHAADDLVQEAAEKVIRNWGRVRTADQPDAYVRTILVNAFLSTRRRRYSRDITVAVLESGYLPGIEDDYVERDMFWAAVMDLPRQQRAVLALRYYEDLPDIDIGKVLGIAPSTVRVTAHHALRALRVSVIPADPARP
jgi:RNA polymerase sigma-70 factor (sigma-E family)